MAIGKKNKRQFDDSQQKGARGAGIVPALCNVLGTLLLLVVIGLSLPLVAPMLAGYQVYDVVSSSMEPDVPMGSAVFVKMVDPAKVNEGDIIAFYDGDAIIVHRVQVNRTSLGEFVTKGDANDVEDLEPIPYANVVGRVDAHVPRLGGLMTVYSSTVGKIYLLLTAACGVMLNMLAGSIRRARLQKARPEQQGSRGREEQWSQGDERDQSQANAPKSRSDRFRTLRLAAMTVLAVIFLGSAGVVGYVIWQYHISDALYADASQRYTRPEGPVAPISVDFESLCAENPDVVGWIYCEGTPINYPVLQGKDNDQYLYHDYTGAYNIDGSIFVDADNAPRFADSNTIIYGHNMNSGSMFACLEKWRDQGFYEEHPVIWLLTPEQDYEIVLFSGRHVGAHTEAYDIISQPGEELKTFLTAALDETDFTIDEKYAVQIDAIDAQPGLQLDLRNRYVMLSTCAYVFDDARYVLHGMLVPAKSNDNAPTPEEAAAAAEAEEEAAADGADAEDEAAAEGEAEAAPEAEGAAFDESASWESSGEL